MSRVRFDEAPVDHTDTVASPDWVPKATLADGTALDRQLTRGRTRARTTPSITTDIEERVEKLQSADHVRSRAAYYAHSQ